MQSQPLHHREEWPPFSLYTPFFSTGWSALLQTLSPGTNFVRSASCLALVVLLAQAVRMPAQAPAQKPSPKPAPQAAPQPSAQEEIPSPVSHHYPILLVAHGNEPSWSLRLGMKGPQRLDRAGYPPIILDPAEVTADPNGISWTYSAKDDDTGASVAVKITRASCSDSMSDTKYTFEAEVDHAQIGPLKGCAISDPEKFPEFRKKNQLDAPDDATAKDQPLDKDKEKEKEKKAILDPITGYHSPTAIAYLDASGRVIVAHGELRKTAAPSGVELSLSHDGKSLLYTRSDSKTGPERSIVLYDFDSGRSRVVAGDNVRQPFWSPDDSRFAFLKFDGKIWQVWVASTTAPEKATLLSPTSVDSLHGWVNPNTVLAADMQNAFWLGEDKPAQTVPLKDIYGDVFQIISSDSLRVNPLNSDLLVVSAYYLNLPPGAPTDQAGLSETFFLYEIRSHRRTLLGPSDTFTRDAVWSRDGVQLFFTRGVPGKSALATDRMFWDSTGLRRYSTGHALVIGR